MRGDKIVKFFMPKEERFHELLARDTEHLVRSAHLFVGIANSQQLEDRRAKVAQLRELEHEGDLITKEIFSALNSTFITPLDREDIRSLAADLDDILDYTRMMRTITGSIAVASGVLHDDVAAAGRETPRSRRG